MKKFSLISRCDLCRLVFKFIYDNRRDCYADLKSRTTICPLCKTSPSGDKIAT